MRLTAYEKQARREIDRWEQDKESLLHQAFNWSMRPVDWMVDQVVAPELMDQASQAVGEALSLLNDASAWTFSDEDILQEAQAAGLEVTALDQLRDQPLETLDDLARRQFNRNTLTAALEGGGLGLGGAAFLLADIPLLFTINFRLILQISSAYGFSLRGTGFRPLVLAIYNVAASGRQQARQEALREISVAAAAFAQEMPYRGRSASSTWQHQNRHLPREIGKHLVGRKLGQAIPVAGAAVGAGVNYWFTRSSAEAAYMLFRALYLERKERR